MKTYLEKIHESELYALDQTIKVWTAYEEHDLHEFESGCANIVRLCYIRLEELERENA